MVRCWVCVFKWEFRERGSRCPWFLDSDRWPQLANTSFLWAVCTSACAPPPHQSELWPTPKGILYLTQKRPLNMWFWNVSDSCLDRFLFLQAVQSLSYLKNITSMNNNPWLTVSAVCGRYSSVNSANVHSKRQNGDKMWTLWSWLWYGYCTCWPL